ncbi:MAG TPA: hypothetical protein VFT91_04170 [Dehalococcoidia bacterium]|nr:hypothetical protein [Dehalococcoidia bacterium]
MNEQIDSLERVLLRLSRPAAYPATPDLAAAVRRRLASQAAPRTAAAPRWALAAVMAAAILVALGVVIGVAAPAREAVADLFERIHIFQAEQPPAGLPEDIGGTPVTLAEAEARLGFQVKLPAYPEGIETALARVLYQEFGSTGVKAAALFFEPAEGAPFVLFESNARVGKGLAVGATAERVQGLGDEAYWLKGLRIVEYYDPQGNFVRESERRTEANTLVWAEQGLVFRLEGDLSKDEAARMAQSLR